MRSNSSSIPSALLRNFIRTRVAHVLRGVAALAIKGPGIKVGGNAPDAFTISDAIRVRELLGNLGANVQASCNVKLNSGIAVSAGLRDAANQIISGEVAIAWPDVFGNDCLPDTENLSVTPNLGFNEKLKVLDRRGSYLRRRR